MAEGSSIVLTGTDEDDILTSLTHYRINGGDGDDNITGTDSDDVIHGNDGNDVMEGGAGNDTIFGNDGDDTAVYSGSIFDYSWEDGSGNSTIVTDNNDADGDNGVDTLKHVESLQFDDYVLSLVGNNAAIVSADDQTTDEETDITFTVSAYDFDGDANTITSATAESGAAVTVVSTTNADNETTFEVNYDPGTLFEGLNTGETAVDQVTIEVDDGNGGVTTKVVNVTVEGIGGDEGDNMGFEYGDFTDWETLGSTSVGSPALFEQHNIIVEAAEGDHVAELNSSSGAVFENSIETFLGLGINDIDSIVDGSPTNGSAIKTSVTVDEGDTISFSWRFITDDYRPFVDTSFFSFDGNITKLASVENHFSVPYADTGWQTASVEVEDSGTYDFGFGVVNALDGAVNSAIYIDDFSIS